MWGKWAAVSSDEAKSCGKVSRKSVQKSGGEKETNVNYRGVYPPTTKALFHNFPLFPSVPHSPFRLSSPLPLPLFLPCLPFPSCREADPLKLARRSGERCKLPQWGQPTSILVYSEIEKKLIWQQLLYGFLYTEFVKLLIKSPKLSLAHLSPTVDWDRRPWLIITVVLRYTRLP